MRLLHLLPNRRRREPLDLRNHRGLAGPDRKVDHLLRVDPTTLPASRVIRRIRASSKRPMPSLYHLFSSPRPLVSIASIHGMRHLALDFLRHAGQQVRIIDASRSVARRFCICVAVILSSTCIMP